ncbi:hypothetical protein E2C01_097922 [Portunus trituberculatus]|uniref:Uncharacterized protein n=1 Tax=Portunus trituberculatus TaxID=210409 RepID=A0A5B7KCM8_PORTR|nr:hypothetical protein [Portunus trituberculatus]
MYTCTIQPPSEVALGFDKFWAYYFFDKENCENKGMNSPPDWTNYNFTLTPEERSLTTPYDNFIYQCIYLALHGGWILTGIILIYGKVWCVCKGICNWVESACITKKKRKKLGFFLR